MRRLRPDEHRAVFGAVGSTVAQVVHDPFSHVPREREAGDTVFPDHQLTPPPVDIVEAEAGDLTGAQTQPGEQGEDRYILRPVATVWRSARAEQRGHLTLRQRLRQTGERPAWRGGDRLRQWLVDRQPST